VRKDAVYELLMSRPDTYLSGEEISEKLGVSRAAVWKAVERLRRDGAAVEARPGCGYRLQGASDALTAREIGRYLRAPRENLVCLGEVDSTNSYCKRIATEGAPDGTVVVADCQIAGRGRLGRSFQSPAGQGIYLSVLWRPALPPEKLLPLTALGAVAVCRAVEKVTGIRPGIKWTNDVVYGGRKLCGILTEMAMEGESGLVSYVVMGIGVNVHQTAADFDGEVAQVASSLDTAMQNRVSRPKLAAALMEELDTLHEVALPRPTLFLEEYRKSCVTLGKTVTLMHLGKKETVYARDVDPQYGLIVDYADGREETVRSGEVSVRGENGYTD
jgi:BirA family biotin operon repressor/biotin-[acetyl-CoA-carboxylase] ligase